MPEAELSGAVTAWFEAGGFQHWAEVPIFYNPIDHWGWNPKTETLIGVEMKTCLTKKVMRQAFSIQMVTPHAYCVVGSDPRDVGPAAKMGLGVATVKSGELVVILKPRDTKEVSEFYRAKLLESLLARSQGGVGGMPNLKGEGPAQDMEKAIAEFRASNPGASWREVYEKVPNHYASCKSMQSAMYTLRQRRHWAEARKEWRARQKAKKAGGDR